MARARKPRPRSAEKTRADILSVARQRFAADGYERATIRGIAAEVGVDGAMVIRYFGSKEKLFAAAADFDLRLPDLSALPRAQVGAAFTAHFVERWEADDTFMALLRAAVTHDAAAKQVRAVLAGQVLPAIAALSDDPGQAGLRAGLVASQLLGMALCRYVLQLPPVVGMTRSDVIAWLGPTLQRYITEAVGEPGRARPRGRGVRARGKDPQGSL